ncbi:MAG TPA: AAA family ATPase [Ktedonobacteraceae bacterium]|nr:AAA family ATPase [Ktedonobacteraceae bacterium]
MEKAAPPQKQPAIVVPHETLLVLCGPAGSGKSTFARTFVARHRRQGYKTTTIVSSDYCRSLVCDDETNQQVNRDTFDLFYYIMHKRMFHGRFTIADSTALQADARRRLRELAARHQYHTCLIVFNMSLATCLRHDQLQSRGRVVGEAVITYHVQLLQQALPLFADEGWSQVHILDEQHPDLEIELPDA